MRINVPQVTPELIQWLDSAFPLQGFLKCTSESEMYRLQGSRQVVSLLMRTLEDQHNDFMKLNQG